MSDFDADRVRVRVQSKPAVNLSVIDAGDRDSRPVLFFVQGAGGHALQWSTSSTTFPSATAASLLTCEATAGRTSPAMVTPSTA